MSRSIGIWCTLLSFLLLLHFSSAEFQVHDSSFTPDYVLVATAQNVTIDCQSRYSVVFNGSMPGPPLYIKAGISTWVRVYNDMTDQNVTVHWHGIPQHEAPFSDGSPLVSQWAIAPQEFFDYEITPGIFDAGTYFYHSHVGFQAVTAHGILIVEDDGPPPYQYDDDIVISFADFYKETDSYIVDSLLGDPFKWPGEPDALLMNGCSGNTSFDRAMGPSCAPAIIDVKPGLTYRLRYVGKTAITLVSTAIEGHNQTIIEADGKYTLPYEVDHLQIGTGQRFSTIFTAKTEEEIMAAGGRTEYWLRYEGRDRPNGSAGYALIRYQCPQTGKSAPLPPHLPAQSPMTIPDVVYDWLEYALETLDPGQPFPRLNEVTRTIWITEQEAIINGSYSYGVINGSLVWEQNGLPWQDEVLQNTSYTPLLVNMYTNGWEPNYEAALKNGGWDPNTLAFPALVGETLDIVWQSNSGPRGEWDFHPMHAHGGQYWDLGAGNGTYNAVENEKRFANYTPALRDTTMLYSYASYGQADYTSGWRAWRLRVTEDNVGAWMMHCHILQHMIMGMQTAWVFGNRSEILAKFPEEPYVQGYLTYGGSAYGNATFDPLVNHSR